MRYNLLSRLFGFVVLIVLLAVAPFVVGLYYVDVLTLLLINAILVVSFRLIALVGEFSFCHIALMGVGAYTTALITTKLGWSFWVSLPLAGLVSALVALVLSFPLLRMKGFYFFMGSFAAGEAMRLSWLKFELFGRHAGIDGLPFPRLPGVDFHNLITYYYLTLVVTLLCLVVMYRLEKSRIGNTLKSIAEQDFLAQSIGVSLWKYKAFAFVGGSLFAGIAGALFAHRLTSVDAFQFGFVLNLAVIVWSIFGGLSSFAGPLTGLVTLTVVEEAIHRLGRLEAWTPFIYGFLLIGTLLFMPKALIGSLQWIIKFLPLGQGNLRLRK